MNKHEQRKKALQAYKERDVIGGVYRIVNTQTGWQSPLVATTNLEGHRNRLAFAKKTNTRFDEMLRDEWAKYGPEPFELVAVEQLVKKPEMSQADFIDELDALLALWREKENAG